MFDLVGLFTDKISVSDARAREDLCNRVAILKDELVRNVEDSDGVSRVLDEKGSVLFRGYSDGSAFVELLKQLNSWPHLALEVFFSFLFLFLQYIIYMWALFIV